MSFSKLCFLGFLICAAGMAQSFTGATPLTDLERDLSASLGSLGSPYQNRGEAATQIGPNAGLNSSAPLISSRFPGPDWKLMEQFGELVLECAAYHSGGLSRVISNCSSDRLSVSYNSSKLYSLAKLCVSGSCYTAVAFDSQVDRSPMYFTFDHTTDLAIYSPAGSLIGVVQHFVNGPSNTVLEDIAKLENIAIASQP